MKFGYGVTGALATWWVVSTVRDDERRLIALADRHLSLGAIGVTYYLDAPEDPFPYRLAALPNVEIVTCGPDYWRGNRPFRRADRQAENVWRSYRGRPADWLLHIDSDEAVHTEGAIGAMLDATPSDIAAVRLPVLERMCGPSDTARLDGLYRRGLDRNRPRLLNGIYRSPYASFLRRGLLGHHRGKCFFRTGLADLKPGIHDPNEGTTKGFAVADARGAYLLHRAFDDWRRIQGNIEWRVNELGPGLVRPGGWSGGIYNLAAAAFQGQLVDPKAVFDEVVDPPGEVKQRLLEREMALEVKTDPSFAYRVFRDIRRGVRAGLDRRRVVKGEIDDRNPNRRAEGAVSGRG